MEFFTLEYFMSPTFYWGLLQIILIDILLGGDNAILIGLACRNLPPKQRRLGILWGTAGAIILRIVLIAFALTLLALPLLKIVAGALLLWIGIKLLVGEGDAHHNVSPSDRLWAAIKTIIVADAVMSLDNVIAVAAAAKGDYVLVVLGILISIPIVVWGSQLVLKLMDKFPIVITLGAGLLGWLAGGLIVGDVLVQEYLTPASWVKYLVEVIGVILVIGLGRFLQMRQTQNKAS